MEDKLKILEFLQSVEKLKSTLRDNWTTSGRQESAAEHTWRAALLAIILVEQFEIKVDLFKVIKMLLVHDIPEITYGDIPGWDNFRREERKQQERNEAKAIFGKLPKITAKKFNDLFNEFEEGETNEAKVAQAIEKIESQLQHLESGKKYWNKIETGDFMLTYPNRALEALNHEEINQFWNIIKEKIAELSKDLS